MTENETITVDLESFVFWQAEMAHASEKAKNNPNHDGESVHRAHEQMSDVLQEYYEPEQTVTRFYRCEEHNVRTNSVRLMELHLNREHESRCVDCTLNKMRE